MSGNCHECRLSLGTIHVTIGALEIELIILTQKLPYDMHDTDFECFSTSYIFDRTEVSKVSKLS